jgi:hypothetical protein
MSTIRQPERVTQNRVVALFQNELGYRYLAEWRGRYGNSVSEMDAEIAARDAKLARTRILKQGMMQELLARRTTRV